MIKYIELKLNNSSNIGILNIFLYFCSCFYRFGVFIRNFAYENGLFSSFRPKVPTISIGNIVAGGTGKTPLTILLASSLESKGKVAVLSRGYRSNAEKKKTPVRVELTSSAVECGDEPLLIRQRLPNVEVFVGPNRALSSRLAVEQGAEILILDDGLQHRALERDIEIVIVDGADPLSNGYYLPRGLLRESPKALARATLVVINARGSYDLEKIRQYTNAPIVVVSPHLGSLPEAKKVGLLSGIAKPDRFREMVEEKGVEVVHELRSRDHELPPLEEIGDFIIESKKRGATHILCTEKDRVKPLPNEWELPIFAVPLTLSIVDGEEHWNQLLEKIKVV